MSNPNPARIAVDADVLAADLLVGGDARETMDIVRGHSWVELVASDELLDESEWVIRQLADDPLARDWREEIEECRLEVEQSPGDHPALASAHAGNAAHIVSYDDDLRSAKTAATLQGRISVSVKRPDGFVSLFDPESLYDVVVGGEYPGPDREMEN
ncbi:Predicted nucleic acid-binding protein, contains PIN domain [Haladaptatus litoreus]|uniref:Predicted nucleic acid-binding protein, contains PIN domain n=1 Tax=Haladaptatus litoreus TaxID=553468 RepID=A0A1N7BAT8_9EURY|nr:hypothetical protein [Haladaptatus litoreus]SIR48404.1 Predicted nucleic acid-binding protein, contains PIN domain [Haladaptatus litoreus]